MIAVYIFIAISQIRFRRQYDQTSDKPLNIRMWLFPYLSYATIAILSLVYLCQMLIESLRAQFYLSTAVLIVSILLFFVLKKLSPRTSEAAEENLTPESN